MSKNRFVFLIIIFVLIPAGVYLPKDPFSEKEAIFVIEKGEGSKEIALNLEKDGLIWWSPIFRIYVLVAGSSKNLQAGSYLLSPSMDAPEIAGKFKKGDIAKFTVTIPEGFTQKQIEEKLNLKLPGDNLEGYLFPDTYQFPVGVGSEEVEKTMKDNFFKKTGGLKITEDIVIMASLIEKEVRIKEDKELVSGILWKRLRIGMPLQVDAEKWTYQNRGLPENPIASPGLESIKAAIYPKDSQYWYYLSTSEGLTIFSRTLEEHNMARAKYLK